MCYDVSRCFSFASPSNVRDAHVGNNVDANANGMELDVVDFDGPAARNQSIMQDGGFCNKASKVAKT